MKKIKRVTILIITVIFLYGCNSNHSNSNQLSCSDSKQCTKSDKNLEIEKKFNPIVHELNTVLYPFYDKSSNKLGYMNSKGDVILKPQFDYADMFKDGYAIVRDGDKIGVINNKGEFTIDLSCNEHFNIPSKKNDLNSIIDQVQSNVPYKIKKDNKFYGVVDKDGNYIVSPKYNKIKPSENAPIELSSEFIAQSYPYFYYIFVGDYLVANNGKKDILVNKNGKEISNIPFKNLSLCEDFVLAFNADAEEVSVNIIDLNNINNSKQYFSLSHISNDRAVSSNKDGYMLIDNKGNQLTKPFKESQFSILPLYPFTDGQKTFVFDKDGNEFTRFNKSYSTFSVYNENLYLGTNEDGTGEYLNKNGDIIKYFKAS